MQRISRRDLIQSAALGGFAFASGTGRAFAAAAPAPRIERLDPALDAILAPTEPVRWLAEGFGGDIGPAEGPLWWKDGGYLLFSDIQNDRQMKYTPGQGITLFKQGTNRSNGLTRDLQGRLLAAEHDSRRVTRTEADGSITVIANSFQGKRLLRPNDVVVKSDGAIYFTDPGGPAIAEQWDVTIAGVYRVSSDLGTMSLIADDFVGPNGLAFSPDERVLYIADSRRRHLRAFDLQPNGALLKQSGRMIAELGGAEPGNPDGVKVDAAGIIYVGGGGGLFILDASGKKLGRIVHGQAATTNMAFGGNDWKTLYFTTRTHLGAVNLRNAGIAVPVARRA
jgi:gluconolactonase